MGRMEAQVIYSNIQRRQKIKRVCVCSKSDKNITRVGAHTIGEKRRQGWRMGEGGAYGVVGRL